MSSEAGFLMLSGSLAALSLGLVGQTCFFVATQAAYARGDTRTPWSPWRSRPRSAWPCARARC